MQMKNVGKDAPGSKKEGVLDSFFLSFVFVFSLLPYVFQIGFYSDDWGFLVRMATAHDSSFVTFLRELFIGDVVLRQRPTQVLLLAGLYSLFGPAPLGYHLFNGFVLLAAILLLYAILREVGQSRPVAIAVPLLFGLLPNYATDRFWVAAFQAGLSMTFYFASLYADLRAVRSLPNAVASSLWWKLISLIALLLSILSYEVVLPLFVLNPFLLWYQARRRLGPIEGSQLIAKHWLLLVGANFIVLLGSVAYKVLISVRVGVGIESSLFSYVAFLVSGALRVNYGAYGVGLPYVLWWILQHSPQPKIIVAALVSALVVMLYLLYVVRSSNTNLRQEKWGWLLLLGFVVFGSGYAIFLYNGDVWFTSAAVGNRVAIAATVGVAMTYVGVTGWCASRLPVQQGFVFALLVALLSFSGFLINNVLGQFWVAAYQQEIKILAAIQEAFPRLPQESTLLLDGVCPEIGSAIVFNGPVDLGGAVAMRYRDPAVSANRITPELSIDRDGITIGTFRRQTLYRYGNHLWVFHYPKRTVTPLLNQEAAQEYFHDFQGDASCPPGFSWGLGPAEVRK